MERLMSGDEPCKYCGAYSIRSCEWADMTGVEDAESAPCQHDEDAFGLDPDRLRDDANDLEIHHREMNR